MTISKDNLTNIKNENVIIPDNALLNLPEKVLQFGTGVLLRGLPDYFIDKANRKGVFNGRVAVVKSTSKGDLKDFNAQNGLYTICVRGLENGQTVKENIISSSISRVLSADSDWDEVLKIGQSPDLQIVVSNTTEVGIVLLKECIDLAPPVSFPAKLLAVLYARYKALGEAKEADIVIVATELIPDNGKKLASIVFELAAFNGLESEFVNWLKAHAHFCNSLVDRIVPGKPDDETLQKLEEQLGYNDNLLIMAEPYRLWAIEGGERVAKLLSFKEVDKGVIVKPDIEIYRELKVRLLNGSHTLSSGIAFLAGIDTVANAMTDQAIKSYTTTVMQSEIVPAIPYEVPGDEAMVFSAAVLDRFANPYIKHLWINITFQYTMKMKIRILPVLNQYYKLFNKVPVSIAFGFAAFLRFMRTHKNEENQYFGQCDGKEYLITDDQAAYFYEKSKLAEADYVKAVLSDQQLWETNLSDFEDFIKSVEENYNNIVAFGIKEALTKVK